MFSRPFIMENEIWKFIPDYPSYSISSLGRIKCNHGSYENLIQPWLTKGYCYITLINQHGKKKYQVHRLVGELFIPNPGRFALQTCHDSVYLVSLLQSIVQKAVSQNENLKHCLLLQLRFCKVPAGSLHYSSQLNFLSPFQNRSFLMPNHSNRFQ